MASLPDTLHGLGRVPPCEKQGCGRRPGRQAAEIWPAEAGQGVWPRDWALSDHALVSATFAFV